MGGGGESCNCVVCIYDQSIWSWGNREKSMYLRAAFTTHTRSASAWGFSWGWGSFGSSAPSAYPQSIHLSGALLPAKTTEYGQIGTSTTFFELLLLGVKAAGCAAVGCSYPTQCSHQTYLLLPSSFISLFLFLDFHLLLFSFLLWSSDCIVASLLSTS